ncbi:HSF-type DNA-binding-domain-containing protein [Powellomyces hirtus]|nr:HSF-type DNA-binding-domain-containing protein [Powellomyces hirtus]
MSTYQAIPNGQRSATPANGNNARLAASASSESLGSSSESTGPDSLSSRSARLTSPLESKVPEPNGIQTKNASGHNRENFVYKLHHVVLDRRYQHLINWNWGGTSFIVRNLVEFSREVLPKHFKHNNFASFVRQLNMYGFHKVNKSPRGSRTGAENQIWEFSHLKFLRDRPHLLDDIKRKSVDSEAYRRESGDLNGQMQIMHLNQADMAQQIHRLEEQCADLAQQFAESQRKQAVQEQMMKNMMYFMKQQFANVTNAPPTVLQLQPMEPIKSEPIHSRPSFEPQHLPPSSQPRLIPQQSVPVAAFDPNAAQFDFMECLAPPCGNSCIPLINNHTRNRFHFAAINNIRPGTTSAVPANTPTPTTTHQPPYGSSWTDTTALNTLIPLSPYNVHQTPSDLGTDEDMEGLLASMTDGFVDELGALLNA